MSPTNQYCVDFRRLPHELQEKLVSLQRPGDDRFYFPSRTPLLWLVPIAAAVAWVVYGYWASQQPLWEAWMYYLVFAVSMIVFPAAFYALLKLVLPRTLKLKTGFMVTPDELFKVRGPRVEVWNLKDVDALRFKEHMNEIEIWIGDREEKINTSEAEYATKLDRLFDQWKANAGDGIGRQLTDEKFTFNRSGGLIGVGAGILVTIALGAGVAVGFGVMNRNFDDRQTWERTEKADSIEEFENYRTKYPNGIYAAQADQKTKEYIDKLKDKYVVRASNTGDPDAVKAMAALVEQAAKHPARTVYVKITEDRQFDDLLVGQLRDLAGTYVNDYETSVPAKAEDYRKNKLLSDLSVMMNGAFDRGTVKLEPTDVLPPDAPSIEFNLLVRSEKLYYRFVFYSAGRPDYRAYAGASFNFHIDVRPGGSYPPYHMEYVGQPLSLGTQAFDERDKDNFTFDKVYFTAVTEGFDRTWAKTFGFADNISEAE